MCRNIRYFAVACSLILTAVLGIAACSSECEKGDYFFVENDDAIMPVWVKGNTSSKTYIILIHGGPGDSGVLFGYADFFDELEKNYALVYYDQRLASNAQGDVKPESLTMAQFTEDLDVVVEVVRQKYHVPKVFLMGMSWGGGLGTAYLVNPSRQSKVSGWIDIDGDHDAIESNRLSRLWIMDYAKERIAKGEDVEKWESILSWYERTEEITVYELLKHSNYLKKANAYFYDPANEPEIPTRLFFNSSLSLFGYMANISVMLDNLETDLGENLLSYDLTKEMSSITVPAIFLWGRHDGVIPVEMAQLAYDAVSTSEKHKKIVIFEDSAHCPFIEETELFNEAVIEFVEAYR